MCSLTPAFTTAPTIYGVNNLVSNLIANNGVENFFDGSFNTLRWHETEENGRLLLADGDAVTTGQTTYFERYLPIGPDMFAGAPSDFLFPVSALAGGTLSLSYGALTGISGDTTSYTASIEVYADTVGLEGEIRVPPAFERKTEALSGAGQYNLIGTRALYTHLFLTASARAPVTVANAQLAAGTIGDISLDSAMANDTPASAAAWDALARHHMRSGSMTQIKGQLRDARDDNAKAVNPATPTALQGADNAIQTVVCAVEDQRITKLRVVSEGQITPRWSGTLSSGGIHYGRINARPVQARTDLAARALQRLGLSASGLLLKVKTLSKQDYTGPRIDFMPHAVKL